MGEKVLVAILLLNLFADTLIIITRNKHMQKLEEDININKEVLKRLDDALEKYNPISK